MSSWLGPLLAQVAVGQAPPGDLVDPLPDGRPVVAVILEADEGGLPLESLQPLLRVRAGERLDPVEVRTDLATLYRVGEFAAVEAEVLLLTPDPERPDFGQVQVIYRVAPAPRLGSVSVEGERNFRESELIAEASPTVGSVFFPELDGPAAAQRLEKWLQREGFAEAQVTARAESKAGQVHLHLEVIEGPPRLVRKVAFRGDLDHLPLGFKDRRLLRWSARGGLVEGQPMPADAVAQAQAQIRSELARLEVGLFQRRRGFVEARVTPTVGRLRNQGLRVNFTIEPGAQLRLDVDGLLWGQRKVTQALDLDERLRLTRGFLDDAPRRIEAWMRERGFLEAQATVTLDESVPQVQVLQVQIDPGPRFRLPTGSFPNWVGVDFQGNEALTDAELQAVLDQSSPELLRKDRFTREELGTALEAAAELYRSRGYTEARLEAGELTIEPAGARVTRWLRAPWFLLVGRPPPQRVTPLVAVTEGPQTLLVALEHRGGAPEVSLPFWEEAAEGLVNGPLAPQRLQALARAIVLAHREAGWLDAEARVLTEPAGPHRSRAILEIEPGERVLLRSAVFRGHQQTRTALLNREMPLDLGEPVLPSDLAALQNRLYELDVFRSVATELYGDEAARDLVIWLTERPRWTFEVGTGLSTDQGIRTFGRATRRNLFGLAHRAELIGQVGLDYRSDSLRDWVPDIQNPELRAALQYTAPRFPLRSQELVIDVLFRERRQERTFRIARTGFGVALETRLAEYTELRTGARVEWRQLQEVELGSLLDGEPWLSLLDPEAPVLPTPARQQEALNAVLVHDRRDDPVQPSRGWLGSLFGDLAPAVIPQDLPPVPFVKGGARFSAFVPLGALTLQLGAEGGLARTFQGGAIPLEDRYNLGGTGSLRGFARDSLGPRNVVPRAAVAWDPSLAPLTDFALRRDPERWVPTGGDSQAVGTAELLVPLPAIGLKRWEGYQASVFVDVGNIGLLDPDLQVDSQRWEETLPLLRVGTGVGLRVGTPIGPLRFDLAANPQLLQADRAREAVLRGAFEEAPLRAHLTLGALF